LSVKIAALYRYPVKGLSPEPLARATLAPLACIPHDRRFALARELPFTTAYHTRFPEYVRARSGMPLSWTYAFLRWFHGPSSAVMALPSTCPASWNDMWIPGAMLIVRW